MADIHAVKFEEINLAVDNNTSGLRTSKSDTTMKKTPSTSRFQVDRVDFKDEVVKVNGIDEHINVAPVVTIAGILRIDTDAEPSLERQQSQEDDKRSYDSPTFVAGSISPTDTYGYNQTFTNDYNDTHFKTFGRNTTEALPHVDHYRNLLSATAALKSRPTLAELHEEKVFL